MKFECSDATFRRTNILAINKVMLF